MTKTMRAAVLDTPGAPLEVRDLPVPEPRPGEVLVRVEACGICHTDLHIRDGQEPLEHLPLVPGHEGIGRIAAHGHPDPRLPVGSRVGIPWIHDTCGECRNCLTGWESYCAGQRANGYDVDGAYAEYCILKEAFAVPIPEMLDPVSAAPLLCAGVTAQGAIRKARVRPGRLCAIFGCGGLGQYGILLAKLAGATVVAVDLNPDALERAARLGADHVLLASEDPGAAIRALGGADACVNFAPTARVWEPILEASNHRSRIVSVAMVGEDVPLSLRRLTFTGETITGTAVGGRQEIQDVLALAAAGHLPTEVTPVTLNEADSVLDGLRAGTVPGRRVIVFSEG